MFPLVHYFVNKKIFGDVPKLMVLGGLWPDLAIGTGYNRNAAHEMGAEFYVWCKENAPQAIPLAQGIISHGSKPFCVDYYSDEYWPGCERGFAFAKGVPYIQRVGETTRMPERFWKWKAHNFVEMSFELMASEKNPNLAPELLAAVADHEAKNIAAIALSAYTGKSWDSIYNMFSRTTDIFAIKKVSPFTLSDKQCEANVMRFKIFDSDRDSMAKLLQDMCADLQSTFPLFINRVVCHTADVLDQYV